VWALLPDLNKSDSESIAKQALQRTV